jgi:hypothetical protein
MEGRLVVLYRAFGGWSWERLDECGTVIGESSQEFDTPEECRADARMHASSDRTPVPADRQSAALAPTE